MIRTDLDSLMREVRDAQARMRPHLEIRADLIRETAGRHYRPDEGITSATPENYAYTFKSFVKPQLLFGRPLARVEPSSPVYSDQAEAIELALNTWGKETSFRGTLSEVLDDCFVGFGVTMCGVSQEPFYHSQGLPAVYGDFENVPSYPFCVRIDPRNFLIDSKARTLRDCRILGHTFEQDYEDLARDPRNDPEAIERLKAAMADESRFPSGAASRDIFGDKHREAERRRVAVHELYLPEHGMWVAIGSFGGEQADGVILRQERFHGPDEGPFTLWGLDSVAGELIPLSPLVALWDGLLEVVTHARAAARSAATHKKIGVYQAAAKEDAKRIQNARSGVMVGVADPASVKDFEIGGASQSQLEYIEYRRNRSERDLGFGSAQMGVAGKETATGEQIAQANSDLRVDRMRSNVADCLSDVYRKIAWYFWHDNTIAPMETQVPDEQTGALVPAKFFPGKWEGGIVDGMEIPPEPDSDFTDMHFEIDPSSMVKTDNAIEQKRAQDELALCQLLAGMGAQINWRRAIDRYGEKMGTRDLSKILLLDQVGMAIPLDPLRTGPGPIGPHPGAKPGGAMATGSAQMPQAMQSPATMLGLMANAGAGAY